MNICRYLLLSAVICLSSCSVKKFYPLGGAVVGGATGAIGGPVSAGLAAGAGWTMGELAKGDEELKEAKQTIQALSTGDVNALVELRLEKAKGDGFFDSILDGIYDLLFIGAIGVGLWVILPLWYTRYVHKKHKELTENKK
jgi:hypothetical protein